MSTMVSITTIILLVYSVIGFKKGLIKTVLSFGSVLAALFIANMAYGQVSKMIQDYTKIDDNIGEKISESIAEKLDDGVNSKTEQMLMIENLPLPEGIQKLLSDNNNPDIYGELAVSRFSDYVGHILSCIVVNGISFLIIFFVVLIFCKVLLQLAGLMTDFPLVGWVDSMGGLALGFIKGLIMVWLIYFFITMCSTTQWGINAFDQIQNNGFTRLIYDHNMLTELLYNLSKTLF